MQTTTIEQEILSIVHGLPEEIQQEVLKFSLKLKNKFQENQAKSEMKITIPTFYGDGLQKGIDLNNSRELLDILDEDGITGH
ncbi:MAG: hypothetical protein ACU837_02640 [Gammaproteobacteria bacterium]